MEKAELYKSQEENSFILSECWDYKTTSIFPHLSFGFIKIFIDTNKKELPKIISLSGKANNR